MQQTVHLLDFCVYKLNFMVVFWDLGNDKHRLEIKETCKVRVLWWLHSGFNQYRCFQVTISLHS